MSESLTGAHADWTVGIVRIQLAVIFSAPGAQKLLGWYGAGLAKSMRAFAEDLHLPRTFGVLSNRARVSVVQFDPPFGPPGIDGIRIELEACSQ